MQSNDIANDDKDVTPDLRGNLTNFIRVPIGSYQFQLDADTMAHLGGTVPNGVVSVRIKEERLVV